MRLAAHQPCYLPSISFFQKLFSADVFILADDYQYTTHNAINRARIKTARGTDWLTVPVLRKSQGLQKINQVKINLNQKWTEKHWRTFHVNYVYSAYFEYYIDNFEPIYHKRWTKLVNLNMELIWLLLDILQIKKKVHLSSQLDLAETGNEKIFSMLRKSGCESYVVDRDLKDYLDPALFNKNGFKLEFLDLHCPLYHQQHKSFIENLSVIDLVFNEGPESIKFLMSKNDR